MKNSPTRVLQRPSPARIALLRVVSILRFAVRGEDGDPRFCVSSRDHVVGRHALEPRSVQWILLTLGLSISSRSESSNRSLACHRLSFGKFVSVSTHQGAFRDLQRTALAELEKPTSLIDNFCDDARRKGAFPRHDHHLWFCGMGHYIERLHDHRLSLGCGPGGWLRALTACNVVSRAALSVVRAHHGNVPHHTVTESVQEGRWWNFTIRSMTNQTNASCEQRSFI